MMLTFWEEDAYKEVLVWAGNNYDNSKTVLIFQNITDGTVIKKHFYNNMNINSIDEMEGGEYFLIGGFYQEASDIKKPMIMIIWIANGWVIWSNV